MILAISSSTRKNILLKQEHEMNSIFSSRIDVSGNYRKEANNGSRLQQIGSENMYLDFIHEKVPIELHFSHEHELESKEISFK